MIKEQITFKPYMTEICNSYVYVKLSAQRCGREVQFPEKRAGQRAS